MATVAQLPQIGPAEFRHRVSPASWLAMVNQRRWFSMMISS
jgi:hypothetical protein